PGVHFHETRMPRPTLGEAIRSVHVEQERATGTKGSEHAGERFVQILKPQEIVQAVVPRGHEIELIVGTQSAHVTFDETDLRMGLAGFASGNSKDRGGSVEAGGMYAFHCSLHGKYSLSGREVI